MIDNPLSVVALTAIVTLKVLTVHTVYSDQRLTQDIDLLATSLSTVLQQGVTAPMVII